MPAAVTIILPVFLVIVTGLGAARAGLLGHGGVQALTRFVFYISVPALLFRTMVQSSLPAEGLAIIGAYYGACLLLAAPVAVMGRRLFALSGGEAALMVMTSSFSNIVLVGIPIIHAAFGDRALGTMGLVISLHSVLFVSSVTLGVEIARGAGRAPLAVLRGTVGNLIRNPILLSLAAGALWGGAGLPFFTVLDSYTEIMGRATTPVALFVLGASLHGIRLKGEMPPVFAAAAVKLLLLPLLVYGMARFVFALDPFTVAVLTAIAAMPTGGTVFILAEQYGLFQARAASAVLLSTMLSMLTLGILLSFLVPGL